MICVHSRWFVYTPDNLCTLPIIVYTPDTLCTLPILCVHSPFPWCAKIWFYLRLARPFMFFCSFSIHFRPVPSDKKYCFEPLTSRGGGYPEVRPLKKNCVGLSLNGSSCLVMFQTANSTLEKSWHPEELVSKTLWVVFSAMHKHKWGKNYILSKKSSQNVLLFLGGRRGNSRYPLGNSLANDLLF